MPIPPIKLAPQVANRGYEAQTAPQLNHVNMREWPSPNRPGQLPITWPPWTAGLGYGRNKPGATVPVANGLQVCGYFIR